MASLFVRGERYIFIAGLKAVVVANHAGVTGISAAGRNRAMIVRLFNQHTTRPSSLFRSKSALRKPVECARTSAEMLSASSACRNIMEIASRNQGGKWLASHFCFTAGSSRALSPAPHFMKWLTAMSTASRARASPHRLTIGNRRKSAAAVPRAMRRVKIFSLIDTLFMAAHGRASKSVKRVHGGSARRWRASALNAGGVK